MPETKLPEINYHIAGWVLTALGAMISALYRGLWKAINTLRDDLDETRDRMAILQGEHNLLKQWDGMDRRGEDRREPKIP